MAWEEVKPHGTRGLPSDKVLLGATKLTLHPNTVKEMGCTHVTLLFDKHKLRIGIVPANEGDNTWVLSKTGKRYGINTIALVKAHSLHKFVKNTYPILPPPPDGDVWTIDLNKGERKHD